MAKLITESSTNVKCLTEDKNGKKEYFVEGVFMQAEVRNKNRRIYPKSIIEREVSRYKQEFIDNNRAYGELNHPATPTIDLTRVSHIFEDLHMDGTNAWGRAKVVDTPNGKIVKSLIDAGASLGVSSRGTGTLAANSTGASVVQEDFRLATAGDIVANPSAPDAFVSAVMEEQEWIQDSTGNWRLLNSIEEMKKAGRRDAKKMRRDTAIKVFEEFMRELSS